VVRHVYNAQDATDFRTHEAATAAVHGVVGTLVGTSDTQTLANKTLTSPTVNGGALSGTLTGSPTLSGAPAFTGGPIVNTLSALFHRTNTTDPAVRVRLDADSQSRLITQADGKLVWGSGNATGDTVLYRESADTLTTDDIFRVIRAAGGDNALSIRVSGDANSRALFFANGQLWFGDGAAGVDTNLYRSAANTLRTDDSLSVGGELTAATHAITTATGTSVVTVDSDWTLLHARGIKVAGTIHLLVRLQRASTNITANSEGNMGDEAMFTLASAWRPNSNYGTERLPGICADGFGSGSVLLTSDTGVVDIASWQPNASITTDRFLRVYMSFPA
jgi:hypothetical protein